jgi:GNAT superfamily N-acetyltransferase/catechol 2,3-dioxygenase-like lactoylglutathione lyase family enzyme
MMPSIQWVTQKNRAAAVRLLQAQYEEHAIELSPERLDSAVGGMIEMPERGAMLIALDGDQPVGLAVLSYVWTLEHGGRVAWLDELYVVPAKRDQGLGAALLARAHEQAVSVGCNAIELEVDAKHRRAERLYRRAGFEPLPRSRWSHRLEASRASSPGHRPPASLDHISLGVNDLAQAKAFYDAALAPLGLVPQLQIPGEVAYRPAREDPNLIEGFALYIGFEDAGMKQKVFPSVGFHLALRAPTREAVRRFHRAALAAGGRDQSAPGLRPAYHANYYGAFVLDPDGHHLEAVCHAPESEVGA